MRFVTLLFLAAALPGCDGEPTIPDDAPDGGPDDTECPQPLDAETLQKLAVSIEPNLAMQPGESRTLELGVVNCCYFFDPVETCARWSATPAELATIDPATGRLTIAESAEPGEVVTVTADVEDGRREVAIDVYVYTPEANPLFGYWREDAQLPCDGGSWIEPERRINELRFRADGTVQVTWVPFELYVDYWGDYAREGEILRISNVDGNYVPPDLDPEGSFEIDDQGRLILRDLWLGAAQGAEEPARCGHRFTR